MHERVLAVWVSVGVIVLNGKRIARMLHFLENSRNVELSRE